MRRRYASRRVRRRSATSAKDLAAKLKKDKRAQEKIMFMVLTPEEIQEGIVSWMIDDLGMELTGEEEFAATELADRIEEIFYEEIWKLL
jgi:hypothetical protein